MQRQSGYTLLELIIVILLLGLMLGITTPKIREAVVMDQSKKVVRQLLAMIRSLKQTSISDQKTYVLFIDISGQKFWKDEVHPPMEEENTPPPQEKIQMTHLPKGMMFSRVLLGGRPEINSGIAEIHFYPQGYCDDAQVEMREGTGIKYSLKIEPFLPEVELIEG